MKLIKHGSPKWLLRILNAEFPEMYRRYRGGSIAEAYWTDAGHDHPRTYKDKVAVWQPYYAHGELGTLLIALAKHGIKVDINGTSPYYSGRTFTIVMWRPEDHAIASELFTRLYSSAPKNPGTEGAAWL